MPCFHTKKWIDGLTSAGVSRLSASSSVGQAVLSGEALLDVMDGVAEGVGHDESSDWVGFLKGGVGFWWGGL